MLWACVEFTEFGCLRRVVTEIIEMKVESKMAAIQWENSGEFFNSYKGKYWLFNRCPEWVEFICDNQSTNQKIITGWILYSNKKTPLAIGESWLQQTFTYINTNNICKFTAVGILWRVVSYIPGGFFELIWLFAVSLCCCCLNGCACFCNSCCWFGFCPNGTKTGAPPVLATFARLIFAKLCKDQQTTSEHPCYFRKIKIGWGHHFYDESCHVTLLSNCHQFI